MSDVKDAVKLEPGEWLTADGRTAVVCKRCDENEDDDFPWLGYIIGERPDVSIYDQVGDRIWSDDGTPFCEEEARIVGRAPSIPDRIASLEAENAALQTELDSLREYKRLSENDALIRRIREVCEKHDPASLELEPYAQVYAIECVLDGQAGALDDWHEFFEFAANGETALSVIERYEAWKAARKNSPVAKAMLRTMEGGEAT